MYAGGHDAAGGRPGGCLQALHRWRSRDVKISVKRTRHLICDSVRLAFEGIIEFSDNGLCLNGVWKSRCG